MMPTVDSAAEKYLAQLRSELRSAPRSTAETILADVRAHIDEATADGRSIDDVLAGLGDPAAIAADAVGGGVPTEAHTAHDRDEQLVLAAIAAVVGLITATIASFFTPVSVLGGDRAVDQFGLAVALLAALPAVAVAAPLVTPRRFRTLSAAVAAVTVTIVIALPVAGGLLFIPVAMLAWASVVVPLWRRSGRGTRVWRALAAIAVLAPALAYLGGMASGAILVGIMPVAITVVALGLAVAVLLGRRPAYVITLALGAVATLGSVFDPGLLFLAFWWAGGLYLTIGASGLGGRSVGVPR
ncbi:MAG: HAAS signaling domain-containing protein [Microcella sp.]